MKFKLFYLPVTVSAIVFIATMFLALPLARAANTACDATDLAICRTAYTNGCCDEFCCKDADTGGVFCSAATDCGNTGSTKCGNDCRAKGCAMGVTGPAPDFACTCKNTDGTACTGGSSSQCKGQQSKAAADAFCGTLTPPCTGSTWTSPTADCVCTGCGGTTPTNGTITIGPPYNATGPQNINELIANITNWVLGIAGAIAVLFIILAGLRYITAHGDSKQTEAAKTALRNAIIGLVIVVLAFFIVQLIVTVLTNQS